VSLTVNALSEEPVQIALVPFTIAYTTLGVVGDRHGKPMSWKHETTMPFATVEQAIRGYPRWSSSS
jgi:hypothetical protein